MPIMHTAITQRYRKPLDVFLHIKGLYFTDSLCYFHSLFLKSKITFQTKVVRLADRPEAALLRLFFKLLQCEKSFFRMAPMEDRVYHMDAAFGEISNIDAAAVLQHPVAFVKECPPALHMMENAKVQNGIKTLVRKSAQIVRAALDKDCIFEIPPAGDFELLRHDVKPGVAVRFLRSDQRCGISVSAAHLQNFRAFYA